MAETDKTKELRLGLVCYGGVSLAIYMHGMTKELNKLVAASKAFESGGKNPFSPSQVEYVYWKILENLKVRTQVVIDVISGTSAGGINGIFLAKALSQSLSQDALRDIWLEKGELKKIMGGVQLWGNWTKVFWWAVGEILCPAVLWVLSVSKFRLKNRPRPPLNGNIMFGWLLEGFKKMDNEKLKYIVGDSLMPENHSLELFVTMTDFYGYNRQIPIHRPKNLFDKKHRYVLEFCYNPERLQNQFKKTYNPALAFAARATSSFPGAFPPINIADIEKNSGEWPEQKDIISELFRIYELSEEHVGNRYFIDGGVLDNYPLEHTIKAIIAKPAAFEVDRKLIFIDPDPKEPVPAKEEKPQANNRNPGWLATILGSVVGIRSHEPILDDILKVNEFNERVRIVNSIVEASEKDVRSILQKLGDFSDEAEDKQIKEWRDKIHGEARQSSGYSYATYTRMKLQSVVDQITEYVLGICQFPAESNQAFFVRDVFHRWAQKREIVEAVMELSPAQTKLLQTFDLNFSERRIRFIIHYINKQLYPNEGKSGYPSREQLNSAKGKLYDTIAKLRKKIATDNGELSQFITKELFSKKKITLALEQPSFNDRTSDEEWLTGIDKLKDKLEVFFEEKMKDYSAVLYQSFQNVTGGWNTGIRKELLLYYLGFPFWDVLIFPIRYLSDVGELDEIEVMRMSPIEAERLSPHKGSSKLQGVGLNHFGAFFNRKYRENDYLWGRLDAAEQLLHLLMDGADDESSLCKQAFAAILEEEKPALKKIEPLITYLNNQINGVVKEA